MADTSLGRASLSVTADLSGFTTSLDQAAQKTNQLVSTSNVMADASNNVTNSTDKVVQSLENLQQAAVAASINATMFKQSAASAKLVVDQMVLLDGATLLLMKDENELQFQQSRLATGYKELENNLMKTDAAFRNNSLLIELNTQKQKNLTMENKLAVSQMLAMDDAAIGLATNQKIMATEMDIATRKLELQTRQMMLESGATKALHDELVKLEEQEKALALAEDKAKGINQPVPVVEPPPVIEPPKVDTNTPQYVQEQMNLRSETDLATKALELQARQMNVDSGATKKLHDEMVRLEQIEQKLIAAENKARGIPPPLPIKPPPIPVNKNTAEYVSNARKMAQETDLLNRKLDMQARQMAIDSGAAAKLAMELSALEKAEKKLAAEEAKINAAAGRGGPVKPIPKPQDKKEKVISGLGIKDYIGIGFFTSVFDRMFTSAGRVVGEITNIAKGIVDAGAKFQQVDLRLKALTGVDGMAKGLQDIMNAGPSASFESLSEHATRLAALKFDANSVQTMTSQFNKLGVSLGNPERIVALIVDKIGDMAADTQATTMALDKLAEEGINAYSSLARMRNTSEAEAKAAVAAGVISVSEASAAIAALANDPKHMEGFKLTANSFYGVWQTVSNRFLGLMQKIGGYFVDGFSMVNLSDTITRTFDLIGKKLDELKPYFLKFGAFISGVFEIIGNTIGDFFSNWVGKADQFNLEELMKTTKIAVLDFGKSLLETVKLLSVGLIELINQFRELFHNAQKLAGLKGQSWGDWLKHLMGLDPGSGGLRQFLADQQNKPFVPINTDKSDKFFEDQINKLDGLKREAAKPILFGPPKSLMGPETEGNIKKVGDAFAKLNEEIKRVEPPKWEKFLAENMSPLQVFEGELARLNLMLDGTEQGFQAFAIGSANALKKLKESTGLGEVKFAAAITAGSAEDFKATLDAQNQNVDVQQQIREVLAAAAEVQKKQLNAQIEIAQAIKNQRMPKPVNVIAN